MYIVFGSTGSVTIAWIAPATVPLGKASPLWTVFSGPVLGDGPCGMKFWLTWVCAIAPAGSPINAPRDREGQDVG
jgi:hypothetical protein